MVDFLKQTTRNNDRAALGSSITSWVYKPKKSNKFVYYLFGLLGAGLLFVLFYGENFIPWIKKIPEFAFYLLFIVIGPLLNFLKSAGKDQEWTLYQDGVSVRYMNNEKSTVNERYELWKNYSSCTYDSKGVTLISPSQLRKNFRINVTTNVMEIYSICRERISIARSETLQHSHPAPSTPNTPEQRRIARMQQQTSRQKSDEQFSWKDIFSD